VDVLCVEGEGGSGEEERKCDEQTHEQQGTRNGWG